MSMTTERPLLVLDMANNHMGSLEHGLRIVRETAAAVGGSCLSFAMKLQYRDLDTFIHPDFSGREDAPYVKRFEETRLSEEERLTLKDAMAAAGFTTVCTPFDEASVDLIEEHGFDVIKVASCSLTDWPLLERIVSTDLPLIVSTGGASLDDLDKVVSFLAHRDKHFALMHCVAQYPTPAPELQLNQITLLKRRYADAEVGFSTHEEPDQLDPVKLAVAMGATILERHAGVATSQWPLNAYSSTPAQVAAWAAAAAEAVTLCGVEDARYTPNAAEIASLRSLRRGVFTVGDVAAGSRVSDVLLAIPTVEGQLTANDLSKYREYHARTAISARAPVMADAVDAVDNREAAYDIVQRVKGYLSETGMHVPGRLELEISHHYGIERFDEYGATIITFVNREYCKKLIVMLPGQKHPEQLHRVKEETFQVLQGELELVLDGVPATLVEGDIITVERGTRHAFSSEVGCIIEEVSSAHLKEDSYYTDPAIAENEDRKTLVSYWLERSHDPRDERGDAAC